MISRIRLIITALLSCHLFLHPGLLTSQLRPSARRLFRDKRQLSPARPNLHPIPAMLVG